MTSQDSQSFFHWHYAELDDKNFQVHSSSSSRSLIPILILFALLILFTFLCLYARCVCKYQQHFSYYSTSSTTRITTTPTQNPAATTNNSLGLDQATIDKLPIILHKSSSSSPAISGTIDDDNKEQEPEEAAQCSICLVSFKDEEKVKVLPNCKHSYHPECVDKWLITHSNCPLCRSSLLLPASDIIDHDFIP